MTASAWYDIESGYDYLYGEVWTRPGLDRRSRSILNLGMIAGALWLSPLLHTPILALGWAILLAYVVVTTSRSRWRWLVIAHPVLMSVDVAVTINRCLVARAQTQ